MKSEEFVRKLSEAEDLIMNEKYGESLELLSDLKEIELKENFDNNLTHKLYQLISNAESLLNQKRITEGLTKIAQGHKRMDFKSLSEYFSKHMNLNLEPEIVRREIELLILRGKVPYKIKKKTLVLQ
jgi:Rad3-related DNA helicase